jgi:hypothetical protein
MKQKDLEAIKRVARENEALRRFELEGSAALSSVEIAYRAKSLRTFDDLREAQRDMRYVDFCEAIALAVKNRNFSDSSTALYAREWVRSGAAARISFPEWLESEGRERLLVLNEQWLSSGLACHTSFDEWCVSQPGPKPLNIWGNTSNLYQIHPAAVERGLLASIHKTISDAKKYPEDLAHYASFVCGVAVTLREALGIDLNTLTLIVETTPLPSTHPLVRIFSVHAALVWKGYLLALNSYPDSWEIEHLSALATLKILTTVDAAYVLKSLRNESHGVRGTFNDDIRAAARDRDWPPIGFQDLCRKNASILETKCIALFGTSFNSA